MSTKLPGYDDTVVCPYNKCHVILRHRIQTHLVKCARSHPEIQLETCPFDVTHRYRAEDMAAHKVECPSRANFDRYIFSVSSSNSSEPASSAKDERQPPRPRHQTVQHNNDDEEESWDHYNTPTYDPKQYAVNAKVLRQPQGLTPSQRRQFADEERKRLSELSRTRPGQHIPR